jgi:hypothetical protein
MKEKRKPRKTEKPCQVTWTHSPDPAAENEFWRLYLKLTLEVMIALQDGRQEDQDDH